MTTGIDITRIQVLEQLLQTTKEGFWFIDNETVKLDVNPAMCELLGRERDEIIGRPIYDFVDDKNADVFRRQLAGRGQGQSGPYEVSLLRSDGTLVPCLNNASPILNEAGEKIASIGLWTDISDIKAVHVHLDPALRRRLDLGAEPPLPGAEPWLCALVPRSCPTRLFPTRILSPGLCARG
ncbi:MAG: hypothetical protein CL569_02510 [Alphaproteobacteria bacterium]|nr:hypothetical protein [Alphaproteobacteria bacterium]|tara:strand:+ start:181 stop:723 length:543 start_codon:yes stop_codon:yes gene_type:complete